MPYAKVIQGCIIRIWQNSYLLNNDNLLRLNFTIMLKVNSQNKFKKVLHSQITACQIIFPTSSDCELNRV